MSKCEYQAHLYCSDTDRRYLWPYSGHKQRETSSVCVPCEWWLTYPVGQCWVRHASESLRTPMGISLIAFFFGVAKMAQWVKVLAAKPGW